MSLFCKTSKIRSAKAVQVCLHVHLSMFHAYLVKPHGRTSHEVLIVQAEILWSQQQLLRVARSFPCPLLCILLSMSISMDHMGGSNICTRSLVSMLTSVLYSGS